MCLCCNYLLLHVALNTELNTVDSRYLEVEGTR